MKKTLTSLFFIPTILLAEMTPSEEPLYTPWFTGSLLAPSATNAKVGHPSIQPSLAVLYILGKYNESWKLEREDSFWSINPNLDLQIAITDRIGIEAIPAFVTNTGDGKSFSHFQDTNIFFGYQLSEDQDDSWVPDFRLILQTIFPSGKYDHLDPDKEGLDGTGFGSYQLGPCIAYQKLFPLSKSYFLLHWSLAYLFPLSTHVKGFSVYGGGFGTKGTLTPGQNLIGYFSGEYSFTQHWVFAFDLQAVYQRPSSHFSGNVGIDEDGAPAEIGLPSSVQLSFAPQLEYNFSDNFGCLVGTWFTFAGKNAEAFAGAIAAFLYVF